MTITREDLIPAVGEDSPATMMRGDKMRICPSPRQVKTMDLWRRRCMQLWNLLLELEQAAYSGENTRTQIGWRSIWARVVEDSHAEAVKVAREGKRSKGGTFRKEPGARKEPPPLDTGMLDKIRRQMNGAVDVDPDTGEVRPAQPRLFVWEHELQKIMARLKQVPRTQWIGDLPSHAAQSVVKDLIKALQAMLRERKKRIAGTGGRNTGFPKFKKNRYAAGSVYFANTQLKFETAEDGGTRVKLPNGVGWMRCRMRAGIAEKLRYAETTLMGGRIWRQGEDWFLSCQFKVPKPAPLPATGRQAGVKIAAAIPVTVCDDRGYTREYAMPPIDKELLAAHKAAGRAQSRALEARKKKAKKLEARKKWQRARPGKNGQVETRQGAVQIKPLGRARVNLSPAFYRHAATLATLEAADANVRDAWLHELTTRIVRDFDVITVQTMEVARMMKKPAPPEDKADQVKPAWQGKRRSMKAARVLSRRTAMARLQQTLKYKATELRGPQAYVEIDRLEPIVQTCSRCGHKNEQMKDGRRVLRCKGKLPDGRDCKAHLPRNRNAARNAAKHLPGAA